MTVEKPEPDQSGDGAKRQNQGIPYTLRRIQIIDGFILAAIIAVFSSQQGTDDKVDQLLAERKAEKEIEAAEEARDPVMRRTRYEWEMNAIREHVRAVDGRVNKLEEDGRER